MIEPQKQHFINPFAWGWYFISDSGKKTTGLMSKRRARRYLRHNVHFGHGTVLCKHSGAPKSFLRYFTFPVKTG